MMPIKIIKGDITKQKVDVIVNAANTSLLAGSGVCGAIHKAAGSELEKVCKTLGPCPTGQAVLTSGFNLPTKYVIHAVGPRWVDGFHEEESLLQHCYRNIFLLAKKHNIKNIALPAISTGIYRFPLHRATEIAIQVAREFENADLEIIFVCYSDEVMTMYQDVISSKNDTMNCIKPI